MLSLDTFSGPVQSTGGYGMNPFATFSITIGTGLFQSSIHFREVFGSYTGADLSYAAAVECIEPAYRQRFVEAIENSIGSGDTCEFEFPLQHLHDQQLHWVRIIGNMSYDRQRKPLCFTGIVNDITLHKQDELRRNDFIAMVSHDLKSPLTSIQAYMQLIALKVEKLDDSFVNTSLVRVNTAIKKMNSMINGFLTVSGSEEGQIYLELESFQMNSLINEIIGESDFVHPEIPIIFKPGADFKVKADRDKIAQVLNNFLNNAIKYSKNVKHIEISATVNQGMAQICVTDSGIGIKSQDLDKIFERYYRVKRMDTAATAGFGLGLYLSAEIVKRHGGRVWAESEINQGSSFFFSLPLAD
jgi:two-component system CheB/CheR fusion protein